MPKIARRQLLARPQRHRDDPGRGARASTCLLDAHYDSTPTGPGAGDDGLGVAVAA